MTSIIEMDKHAKQWIKEAGSRIRASFNTELSIEMKTNPNDLVTNIDKATEEFLLKHIQQTYPEHRVLGEEGSGHDIQDLSGVVWIIDPIDGTLNFIHQQRNFAISLAVYKDGIGQIGLIYDVVHDELYHAIKGQGAYLNDKKLPSLSDVSVDKAILSLNSSWVIENKLKDVNMLANLVRKVRGTRSYGSAAIELAYIAAGRLDAYITMRLAPWDYAAGTILVEEVGGIASNVFGKPLDYLNGGTLFVAKPGLHQEILNHYLLSN